MSELKSALLELEEARVALNEKRKKWFRYGLISLLIGAAPIVLTLLFPSLVDSLPASLDWLRFFILLLIPGILILAYVFIFLSGASLNTMFKGKVVGELAKEIDPSLRYQPKPPYSGDFLYHLGLIDKSPNRVRAEDYFKGTLGATDVEFFEQELKKVTKHTDSKGNTRTSTEILFKGLVFIADFHKSFNGTTLILPDFADSAALGWLASKLESKRIGDKQIVNLENPDFEKLYTVYSTDQVESRYILSTSFMERMVKLFQRLDAASSSKPRVKVLFHKEKMHMTIHWSNNFFDFDRNKTVEQEVKETTEELRTVTAIVEDLNLNTRIWGKT